MKLDVYYIDAFADNVFAGNPAAVIFSDLDDEVIMQKIAAENNLSETAFINQKNGINHIRWFSPTTEVNLCGHATLASGYVYFNFLNQNENKITFSSASGDLVVQNKDTFLELDFPKDKFTEVDYISQVEDSIGIKPIIHPKLMGRVLSTLKYSIESNFKVSIGILLFILSKTYDWL